MRVELDNRDRENHPGISVLARLRTGATVAQARAEMAAIAAALEKKYPDSNFGHGVRISACAVDSSSPSSL